MKNKGFTLIELLVTITILGIISVMALPTINKMNNVNEERKFEVYRSSLLNSGKLFNNSYADDLFGYRVNGCIKIPIKDIMSKKMLEDIQIKKTSCVTDDSFVVVNKFKNKYYYKAYLGCGTKSGNSVINIKKYPKDRSYTDVCNNDGGSGISFAANPSSSASHAKKSISVTTRLTSMGGFMKSMDIKYAFSTSTSSAPDSEWKTLTPGAFVPVSSQINKIRNGEQPTLGFKAVTLSEKTGKYYLLIKVNKLDDIMGTSYSGKIFHFGGYVVDNQKPIISSLNVVSSTGGYKSNKVYVKTTATDNNKFSTLNELSICISVDGGSCSWVNYNANKNKLVTLASSLNGSTHKVSVRVRDAAGNISPTKTFNSYRVSKLNTVTVNFIGNGAGGNQTKRCSYYDNGSCTVTAPAISRSGWNIVGWGTARNSKTASLRPGASLRVARSVNYYAVTYRSLSATFVYQNGAEYWNRQPRTVYRSCTAYNTGGCALSPPPLNNMPASAKSGCGSQYSKLFSVRGWSTNRWDSTGTFSPNMSSNSTYYSIIVPVAAYINNKHMFSVSAYTCNKKRNSRNVYNRTSATENSLYSDESYVKEGHGFYWSGGWQVNTSTYGDVDRDDYGWLFLVGKGEDKCSHRPKKKWKNHNCPPGSYIKAYQLKF